MTAEAAPGRKLTYAVADLHGRFDLLEAAAAAIETHASDPGTVVFLGDYIDRGPQSAEVVARIVAGPPAGWRWICLKGNHEAMMVMAMRDSDCIDWWIGNGGDTTIASYLSRRKAMAEHLVWFDRLLTMHVDMHRVFVHAAVDPDKPLHAQAEETLLWKRYPMDDTRGYGTLHVVHGHDPNVGGPLCLAGRTDLDTLAWRTGRLVVGVFDDDVPGGPVDLIEVGG